MHALAPLVHAVTTDGKSAITAVQTGLDNLESIFSAIGEKYAEDLEKGQYDTTQENFLDLEAVKKMRQQGRTTGAMGLDDPTASSQGQGGDASMREP